MIMVVFKGMRRWFNVTPGTTRRFDIATGTGNFNLTPAVFPSHIKIIFNASLMIVVEFNGTLRTLKL